MVLKRMLLKRMLLRRMRAKDSATRRAGARVTCAALLCLASLALSGCRRHDFPTYPAKYREYVYVANAGSGTVSALDVVNLRLDREIAVAADPFAVLAAKTRNEVYVLSSGSPASGATENGLAGAGNRAGTLTVVNAETQRVAATLPAGRGPRGFALDPEDRFAYVAASAGISSATPSLVVLDLVHRRLAAEVPLRAVPDRVTVAPDGRSVMVASVAGNELTILNADPVGGRWAVRAQVGGCAGADAMAVLPDSSKVFVACSRGHQVMAVELAWRADARLGRSYARADALEAMLDVGQLPGYLALKPDGGELFVSNTGSNSISEVVTSSDDVGGTYLIGSMPEFGLVSEDNSLLYESSLQSQQIAVYGIDDGRRLGSIHVGDGPDRMTFSARGNLLFAIDRRSGDVAAVRTDTRSLFTLLPVGRDPVAIADKYFTIP